MKRLNNIFSGINLIIIIAVINVLVGFVPGLKIDLTKDRVNTLSKSTKETVRNLNDVVNIKVYQSKDLPANVKVVAADLKSILGEFNRLNKGKFVVEYTDPSVDEKTKSEAIKAGMQPLQFSSVINDKLEVSNGFLGLTISYGGNSEVMPVAGDVGNMEYFLVSSIKKLTSKQLPVVGLVSENEGLQTFEQILERNYRVISKPVNQIGEFKDEVNTLVLVGLKSKIDEKGVAKIKEFMEKGKGVVIFADKAKVEDNLYSTRGAELGIEGLLKDKGMTVEYNLVADASSAIANFRTNNGTFLTQYPFWIQVKPENINKELPVSSGINSLMMPWISEIKTEGSAISLVSSSENSVSYNTLGDVTPNAKINFDDGSKGKKVLAAINTNGGKLAVFGGSQLISDQFVKTSETNLILALNVVDYLSNDESLLSIRSKSLVASPINNLSDKQKQIIRVLNLSLPTVILLLLGATQWWLRKKNNEKWSELN